MPNETFLLWTEADWFHVHRNSSIEQPPPVCLVKVTETETPRKGKLFSYRRSICIEAFSLGTAAEPTGFRENSLPSFNGKGGAISGAPRFVTPLSAYD